ncbi:MAG: cold shock domain-containing protein [Myxococcota bacterium]
MQVPLDTHFRGLTDSEATEARAVIERDIAKIERLTPNIISCHVAVERLQSAQRSGSPYRVRIKINLPPDSELIVDKKPGTHDMHDPMTRVIHDAFRAMRRQVKEGLEKRRGNVKTHDEPRAFVVRLFPEEDYGFLKTPTGDDVYFHKNAVLHHDWQRLTVGTQVRFEEVMGQKGPQASTVQIIDKPGAAAEPTGDEEVPLGWEAT